MLITMHELWKIPSMTKVLAWWGLWIIAGPREDKAADLLALVNTAVHVMDMKDALGYEVLARRPRGRIGRRN